MVRGVRVIQSQLISIGIRVRPIDNTPWGRRGIDSLAGEIAWGKAARCVLSMVCCA
jgi:hypothetical protein